MCGSFRFHRSARRHGRAMMLAVLVLTLVGCAGVHAGAAPRPGGARPERRIVYRDLVRHHDLDLYRFFERYHAHLLRGRTMYVGSTFERSPHVYLDGIFMGDVSALRFIPIETVFEVRLLSATQLTMYSRQNPFGAIDVITWRSRR